MSTVLYPGRDERSEECPITTGLAVLTVDNMLLGKVKEVGDKYFKVDVRWRRDYWLSNDLVAFVDDRVVGLTFRSDETELYKVHRPMTELDDGAIAIPSYRSPAEDRRRWENGPYPP